MILVRPLCRVFILALASTALSLVRLSAESSDLSEIVTRLKTIESELDAVRSENHALRQELGMVERSRAPVTAAAPTVAPGLRLSGELRLRYEGFYGRNPAFVDRNRFRLRLRLGGTMDLPGNVELGLRLTTGVAEGEPTGNNATWQDNASKKAFALDLAYVKWTPFKSDAGSLALVGGKMNVPLTSSDLVFDSDYTPEGVAALYTRALGVGQTLRVNAAQFVIDEVSGSAHDPMLYAGQVRWDAAWNDRWGTSVGFTALDLTNAARLTNSAVPDVHKGNTRTAAGVLVHDYRPLVFDLAVVRTLESVAGYPGAFPVKVAGDYLVNPEADAKNHAYYAGIYLGKAAKKGSWEFNYRYRVVEADAWYEELADSDSGAFYSIAPAGGAVGYGGGTNVRGHIFAANYAVADYAVLGFTYFATRLIDAPAGADSAMGRLQVNTVLKF